jgi:Macrocin-O-methyltransferase (TylF)
MLAKPIVEFAKSMAFKHTKFGSPTYQYNLEPLQLATLVMEFERVKQLPGNVLEIGVARGMTTRFMCEHIVKQGLQEALTYFALDTFSSFEQNDLKYEVEHRGKSLADLQGFNYNDFEVWKNNFKPYPFVKAIQSDCSVFDYHTVAPLKLSFIDVDLYLPTKKALAKVYAATMPGGVILVDDVMENDRYDGAFQAYMEFCQELGEPHLLVGNKCGRITKPSD